MAGIEKMMENHLLQATQAIEDQLDNEINKLDRMDQDEMEQLREKRLQALKKQAAQKEEWIAQGHGKYFEVPDEKAFFDECKKSKNVVCHFYRDSTFRCKIVDKHLEILAAKHIETKFIKIDAEKCKFLVERLRIVVIPTICLAKDGKTVDYVVGFDDLGGTDEFSTEVLEWRIARADVINYSGDLLHPPGSEDRKKGRSVLGMDRKKNLRGRNDDDDMSDDDDDW
ncbi:thioredoxin domain-containing protein 9 [Lingula anatina]|uniref:Thioredoxin domain-containing protein 9 n=1 Tax=Lingula anatina TaxID=7574 RepID=A0A1S3J3C2_LINAN|nr:thioredoxin domain-containing protein 9-like [Lingula anatina]XP_013416302.1 thioredoxin domain-containing protein 9 [Lingula anatina]|eukprot:XP_013404912.1 thioredoxin domain-containing protein 9-like [Lingula anatina]